MPNEPISQDQNIQNLTSDEAQATLAWMTNLMEQQMPQAQPEAFVEPEMPQNEGNMPETENIAPQENEVLETPNPVEELKDTVKEEIGGLKKFIQNLFGGKEEVEEVKEIKEE